MKIFQLFLILSFLLTPFFCFGKWSLKKKGQDGRHRVYESLNQSFLAVTFKDDQKYDLKKINLAYFKEIEKPKKQTFEYLNITNWKSHNYTIKPLKKGSLYVSFEGSYTNHRKKIIYFKEIHLYKPKKSLQLMASNANVEQLKKDIQIISLADFRKIYEF